MSLRYIIRQEDARVIIRIFKKTVHVEYFTLLVRDKLPTKVHQISVVRVKKQSLTHVDGDLMMGNHVLQITRIVHFHIFHHRGVIVRFEKEWITGSILGPRHPGRIKL